MEYKIPQVQLAICLPGNSFVRQNVQSLIQFCAWCMKNRVPAWPMFSFAPYVFVVRNTILGGGELPLFKGHVDYTHILWVDSDIEFLPIDFTKLLLHDKDIVCGAYMMSPRTYSVSVDDNNMIEREKFEKYRELFEIKWGGLGFMLVKKGVFETLPSPWFTSTEMIGEDVAFCRSAREHGFKIWCDPTLNLTHYKVQPLNKNLDFKHIPLLVELIKREIGQEELERLVNGKPTSSSD